MGEFLAAEKLCSSLEYQAEVGCLSSCGFNNRNSFLTALGAGSLRSGYQCGQALVAGHAFLQQGCAHTAKSREREVSGVSSCKDTDPIRRASSKPDLPKAPSPKPATGG